MGQGRVGRGEGIQVDDPLGSLAVIGRRELGQELWGKFERLGHLKMVMEESS